MKMNSPSSSLVTTLSLGLLVSAFASWARPACAEPSPSKPSIKTLAVRQLSFEPLPRDGDDPGRFAARGPGYGLVVGPAEADMILPAPASPGVNVATKKTSLDATSSRIHMKLVGASTKAAVTGAGELPGKANYFVGSDPAKWRTKVPTYAKVKCTEVYPGIDLVYYGNEQQLEFDFVVAPGADPGQIALQFDGAEKLEVDANGDLRATTGTGVQVVQHKPLVYQRANGERREIKGAYVLKEGDRVGFQIANYDHGQTLVIDPTLSYSTYLGGSGPDTAWAIAADAAGNVYVAGTTYSTDFPTTQSAVQPTYQPENPGAGTVFVTKFTSDGTPVYSTYLGSAHGGEGAAGIAVDASGNAYVTGGTGDPSFPTTSGAFRQSFSADHDAFIAKLSPDGSALVYSTFLGGTDFDVGVGIALDNSGNACIIGVTTSTDFPTLNAFQTAYAGPGDAPGGFGDYFDSKINSTGSALIFSTFLGGSGAEGKGTGQGAIAYSGGIASDSSGNLYVVGTTASSDLPTTAGVFQPNRPPKKAYCPTCPSAFLGKFSANGDLIYCSYLGGNEDDAGTAVAVDASGHAYVTGRAGSCNFPFQKQALNPNGPQEGAFVCKFSQDASSLLYSTFVAGGAGFAIALDSAGSAFVTGQVAYDNGLTPVCAIQPTHAPTVSGGGPYSAFDAFIVKLAPDGSSFGYSTFLGGSDSDGGAAIAVDSSGNAYVAGGTTSSDFPTMNPAQANFAGVVDAFVVKIAAGPACAPGPAFGPFTSWGSCLAVAPAITCPANIVVNAGCGVASVVVNYPTPSVEDACAGVTVTCNPPSGSAFPIGTTTVNCTASDACNKHAACSFAVMVNPSLFAFTGFLAPVGGADTTGGSFASPLRTFKLNSTIPVKFTASCGGSPVLSGVHRLQVLKHSDQTTAGDPIDATPTDAATTGDQFRLTDSQWQFNLDTKATGMSAGIWLLRATLSDGSQHSAWIQIK